MTTPPISTPPPGSDAAIAQGCTCPVLDNAHGQGIFGNPENGHWITQGCPLHDKEITWPQS